MLAISKPKKSLPPVKYDLNPKFGTVFTPYYLSMKIKMGQNSDFSGEIRPFTDYSLSPGTAALHYGQSIFEGMKAFRQKDGHVALFRPQAHAARFRRSAQMMCMAEVPEDIFVQALKEYVHFMADNVPSEDGHSLYLRPLLYAADPMIKVGTSQTYDFLIMSTIAGGYFQSGQKPQPAKVLVGRSFVRAFPGGTGEAKTAGNYAASIRPHHAAVGHGCDQVLYLDALEHEYIDELGGMNFFFIRNHELVTPALNGCILRGVTRQSLLEMASSLNLEPREEKVSMTQLVSDIESGKVKECFACGTAAVISPIGAFYFQDKMGGDYRWVELKGPHAVTNRILSHLSGIQRGTVTAPGDWLLRV